MTHATTFSHPAQDPDRRRPYLVATLLLPALSNVLDVAALLSAIALTPRLVDTAGPLHLRDLEMPWRSLAAVASILLVTAGLQRVLRWLSGRLYERSWWSISPRRADPGGEPSWATWATLVRGLVHDGALIVGAVLLARLGTVVVLPIVAGVVIGAAGSQLLVRERDSLRLLRVILVAPACLAGTVWVAGAGAVLGWSVLAVVSAVLVAAAARRRGNVDSTAAERFGEPPLPDGHIDDLGRPRAAMSGARP